MSRLLEEAGISYRLAYEPDPGARSSSPTSPTTPSRARRRPPFLETPAIERARPRRRCACRAIRPGAVALRDLDFRGRLTYPLFGKAAPRRASRARWSNTATRPTRSSPRAAGAERAAVADEKEARPSPSAPSTRCAAPASRWASRPTPRPRPGIVFTWRAATAKSRMSAPNALLVLEQRIDGTVGGQWSIASRAVVADTPWRPAMSTPRPAHPRRAGRHRGRLPRATRSTSDDHGRVRAQFPWDREGKTRTNALLDPRETEAFRRGFGMIVLPHIGQEVTV